MTDCLPCEAMTRTGGEHYLADRRTDPAYEAAYQAARALVIDVAFDSSETVEDAIADIEARYDVTCELLNSHGSAGWPEVRVTGPGVERVREAWRL